MLAESGRARNRAEKIHALLVMAPILLIAFGPPVWRQFGGRSLNATASGDIDLGILYQLFCYSLALVTVVLWLLRRNDSLHITQAGLLRFSLYFMVFVCLAGSALVSPAPMSTVVFAGLFGIGLLSAMKLAVDLQEGHVTAAEAFEWLHRINLLLVILVLLSSVLDLWSVTVVSHGLLRIKGGQVADLSFCGVLLIIWAMDRYIYRGEELKPLLLIGLAMICLYLPHIRTGQSVALFVVLYYLVVNALSSHRVRRSLWVPMLLFGVPLVAIMLGVFFDHIIQIATRGNVGQTSSLSGRTLIWAWIEQKLSYKPMGIGYVAGFRDAFQSMNPVEVYNFQRQGLITQRIGAAHSSYYEFWIGTGWLAGTYCILVIFGSLLFSAVRSFFSGLLGVAVSVQHQYFVFVLALLIFAFVKSSPVIPPDHVFGVICFLTGMGIYLAQVRTRFRLR